MIWRDFDQAVWMKRKWRMSDMHMADALVAPAVAGTMYACSAVAAGYAIKKVKLENDPKKVPLMGVMGAFVFAGQMINFTIPGTGSSGHLCGGMLLSAILGPYAGFLTMISILLIQSLLFADGGILALGCNIWNMAFYGCFLGGLFLWKRWMKYGVTKKKIVAGSLVGCILTLQLGAFSVTLETLASGITELPFQVFAATMQPIHLAIGLVEGLITSAVLCFLYEARPELIWTGRNEKQQMVEGKISYKKVIIGIVAAFVVIGGGLSLAASSYPDGLEWSIERLTGNTEVASSGGVYETAQRIQDMTALLPDYAWKGSSSAAGTSFSGIVGGLVVIAFCMILCCLFRFFRRKENHGKNR